MNPSHFRERFSNSIYAWQLACGWSIWQMFFTFELNAFGIRIHRWTVFQACSPRLIFWQDTCPHGHTIIQIASEEGASEADLSLPDSRIHRTMVFPQSMNRRAFYGKLRQSCFFISYMDPMGLYSIEIFIQVPFSTQLGYFTQMYLRNPSKESEQTSSVQQKIWIHFKKKHTHPKQLQLFWHFPQDSFFNASNPLRTQHFPLESQPFSRIAKIHSYPPPEGGTKTIQPSCL